jgi:ornithine cyclodeaminase/alanine dehydrogenase-like protein (mu-crystallin family)
LAACLPHIVIHPARDVHDLLDSCQAVTTATTARTPVLPNDKTLLRGKHITAIGSYQPHVREIPQALYELVDTVYIDTRDAGDESGDIIHPLKEGWVTRDQVQTLGQYLVQQSSRATSRDETTFIKSVGMALFDVTAAQLIFDQAVAKGLGQVIAT